MTTVAAHLVEALVHAGVRRIYGVVGDSLNSIVDAVHHNKQIEWIHVRHEEAGAFAASAEAQLTGSSPSVPEVVDRGISILSMDSSTHIRHWRRPGDRSSDSVKRNRHRLFPGNAPGKAVSGMQPLLPACRHGKADAAFAANRHADVYFPRRS